MNIKLNNHIKITRLNKNNNTKVICYLDKIGIIAGQKLIYQKFLVPIIEFKDYTRVWVFTKEIKYIDIKNKHEIGIK